MTSKSASRIAAYTVILTANTAMGLVVAPSSACALPAGTRDGGITVCADCNGEFAQPPANNGTPGGPTPGPPTFSPPAPPPPSPGADSSSSSGLIPPSIFNPINPFTGAGANNVGASGAANGTTLGGLSPASGVSLGDLSPSAGGDMLGETITSAGGIGANLLACVNNLLQRDWDNPSASYECNTGNY